MGKPNIKTIGVLTSGGDAPAMNAAVRAVARIGKERGLKAYEKNSIVNEENLESLSPGILNCTYVWTLMLKINYEKHEWEKREYVDGKKLYPEEWMIEDDAQILEIYTSHPQRWGKYTLYKGKDVTSYITIYKNSKNEYYFCIKYTDFSDWDGIKMD